MNQARERRSWPSASIPGADNAFLGRLGVKVSSQFVEQRRAATASAKTTSEKALRSRPQAAGTFCKPPAARWAALPYSPEPAGRNRASFKSLHDDYLLGAVLRFRSGRSGAARLFGGLSGRSSPPTPPFGGRARKRSERRSLWPKRSTRSRTTTPKPSLYEEITT